MSAGKTKLDCSYLHRSDPSGLKDGKTLANLQAGGSAFERRSNEICLLSFYRLDQGGSQVSNCVFFFFFDDNNCLCYFYFF